MPLSPLITVEQLKAKLGDPDLVILDASVAPVVPGFEAINSGDELQLIPGSRRFDYDKKICKPDSSLPHMMPEAGQFQSQVRELGINQDSFIVVYDDCGIYASPRAWWMFRAMGHEQVAVLDGGLPAWIAAGQETTDSYETEVAAGDFTADEQAGLFCDAAEVLKALDDASSKILDARSAGRFNGLEPEPRPGLRGGHMPGAGNLPCRMVLNGQFLKPPQELKSLFQGLLRPEQRLISSCGSGITACILTLAAARAGHQKLSVYDGSWVEWGMPSKLPVVSD
jgi:thiosulfate/3-mercaptopyruvate sulfurtransferase